MPLSDIVSNHGRMNSGAKESGWKMFRKLVPEARERYLARRNAELIALLRDESMIRRSVMLGMPSWRPPPLALGIFTARTAPGL
jgi:hypothetical protein